MPPSASGNVERTVPSVQAPVGGRVDLLGRHVDEVRDAVDRLLGAGQPAVRRVEPDAQVGARAGEADRAEAPLVEERGALAEALDVLLPREHGVGLVEPGRGDDGVPEPLDVRLAEDGVRPAFVRVADDRPLDQPSVLGVEQLLRGQARARPLGAALVEVGEELGLGLAGDRDRRAAGLDHVVEERERPRRRPVERVLRRVLDARALQMRVAVVGLDVARAALVGDTRDRADERQVLRLGRDPEELTGLEIDRHFDREPCIPVEPLVRCHIGKPYSLSPFRGSGAGRPRTTVVASSRCSSRGSRRSERRC